MARSAVPAVVSSLAELTDGMQRVGPVPGTDGKSGSPLDLWRRGSERYVLKAQSRRHDWTLRVMGDRNYAGYLACTSAIVADLPPEIDHAIAGLALESGHADPDDDCVWILMHDVGPWLVPEGDEPVAAEVDRTFLDHMAALHARFWDGTDDLGLIRMDDRILSFSPASLAPELARDPPPEVPGIAMRGWTQLAERDPDLAAMIGALHRGVAPLVDQLATTPATFLHGDWKMGNLGRHDDGRTILIDWSYPGFGPGCMDLGWYLALNSARLSSSKEEAIDHYRGCLESRGVDTGGWFETQLGLSLLAITVMFGWEKALGSDEELAWWSDRARTAARRIA